MFTSPKYTVANTLPYFSVDTLRKVTVFPRIRARSASRAFIASSFSAMDNHFSTLDFLDFHHTHFLYQDMGILDMV
jgi:hypothetical protein